MGWKGAEAPFTSAVCAFRCGEGSQPGPSQQRGRDGPPERLHTYKKQRADVVWGPTRGRKGVTPRGAGPQSPDQRKFPKRRTPRPRARGGQPPAGAGGVWRSRTPHPSSSGPPAGVAGGGRAWGRGPDAGHPAPLLRAPGRVRGPRARLPFAPPAGRAALGPRQARPRSLGRG